MNTQQDYLPSAGGSS